MGYVPVDAANVPAVMKKLVEFNTQLQAAAPAAPAVGALSPQDLEALQQGAETIMATSRYHATTIFPSQTAVLLRACHWPVAQRFPGAHALRRATMMSATRR